jgi:hypothetical protein
MHIFRCELSLGCLHRLISISQAVLSVDDDLIISCEDLASALRVWNSNKR